MITEPEPIHDPPGSVKPKPKKSRKGIIGGVIVGFVVGLIAGLVGGGAGEATTAVPGASTTVTTQPRPAATVTVTEAAEPAPEPEPAEELAVFKPRAKDFKIKIKVLSKECFGSAGCNVTYRIDPEYVGTEPIPDTGTIEITYEVKGPEDGGAINTFTIEDGSASFDKEESASTPSSGTKLTAKATDATYNE